MRHDSSSSVSGKLRITSSGIRYSNIVALHDNSTGEPRTLVIRRPRWNQCSFGHVALGDGDEAGEPRFRRQQVVERGIEPRAAELIGQADSRSRTAAAAGRRGTPKCISSKYAAARLGERVEPRRPRAAAVVVGLRSASSRERRRQRQQRGGVVAAVDRRHVLRQQRRQRLRVVPIQQVALEVFEPIDGRRAWLRAASTSASASMKPRSCADSDASRPIAMLVGDVRCAMRGSGSNCTLSGGSQRSSRSDEGLEVPPRRRAPRSCRYSRSSSVSSGRDDGAGLLS